MLDEAGIVALITGLTQMTKMAFLPSRFAGLYAIALGILFSIGLNHSYSFEPIVSGIMYGLSATGFYEGVSRVAPRVTKFVGKMVM